LLQLGAARVYAVDVNVAQLSWKLQQDPRVIAVERNARKLSAEDIPEQVDLVVADVSFISVCKILGPASACAKPGANFLILVKPQFELRREDVGPGGIVEDVRLHEKAIASVRKCSEVTGLTCVRVSPSRLTGAEGNQEYFLHARKGLLK
jgi:23S rRNA (cytidine1920-2'-O)/16S rRNA (cytidine1409-2'-O)-methyltransferase